MKATHAIHRASRVYVYFYSLQGGCRSAAHGQLLLWWSIYVKRPAELFLWNRATSILIAFEQYKTPSDKFLFSKKKGDLYKKAAATHCVTELMLLALASSRPRPRWRNHKLDCSGARNGTQWQKDHSSTCMHTYILLKGVKVLYWSQQTATATEGSILSPTQ